MFHKELINIGSNDIGPNFELRLSSFFKIMQDVIMHDSDEREIEEVTDLYSFKDTVDILIDSTKDIVSDMENGKESLDYFLILQNHMKEMEQEHNPAYLEADCLEVKFLGEKPI